MSVYCSETSFLLSSSANLWYPSDSPQDEYNGEDHPV